MSEYVPQAWRFGNGPHQYYADQYATSTARLDFDLDYDEDRLEQYKAEFLADLATHDRKVKAEAWDEGYMRGMYPWSDDGQEEDPIPAYMSPPSWGQNSNPYRIEKGAHRG